MNAAEREQLVQIAIDRWIKRLESSAQDLDERVTRANREGNFVQLTLADGLMLANDERMLCRLLRELRDPIGTKLFACLAQVLGVRP